MCGSYARLPSPTSGQRCRRTRPCTEGDYRALTIIIGAGVAVVQTAFMAPNMNSLAEPWVLSVKSECLGRVMMNAKTEWPCGSIAGALRRSSSPSIPKDDWTCDSGLFGVGGVCAGLLTIQKPSRWPARLPFRRITFMVADRSRGSAGYCVPYSQSRRGSPPRSFPVPFEQVGQ